MSLAPIITVDITIDSAGVPRQGFGVPLYASHTAAWAERTRSYASSLEVASDFATDTPEYLCGAAVFAQDNPPETYKIGRVDSDVTQQYTVECTDAVNSKTYSINVSGTGLQAAAASYAADAGTSKAEVHNGLLTALNAFTDKTFTAAFGALAVADFAITSVANATDTLTKVAHGLNTGDGPVQVSNSGGGLPAGLLALTDYWVIKTGADTFKLATTLANALAGTVINLTSDGTGVHTLDVSVSSKSPILPFTVTADAANSWFSLDVAMADSSRIALSQTHASNTLDVDLAAILVEDDEWYCLLTGFNSYAYVKEAAAWVESNARIYAVDFNDTECLSTAFDIEAVAATDLMGALAALTYKRTMYSYHQRPSAFFAAAWMGDWLPTSPGEATAALKTIVGVETTKMTSTQFTNLRNRRGNAYIYRGGRGVTWESTVGSTEYAFLDVTRNIDYLKDGVSTTGFGLLAGAPIIPFTPAGTAQLAGAVLGFLTGEATTSGVLDKASAPTVLPPKFSTIPDQDKKERKVRKLKFTGRLSGAIHAADIDGTVSF